MLEVFLGGETTQEDKIIMQKDQAKSLFIILKKRR